MYRAKTLLPGVLAAAVAVPLAAGQRGDPRDVERAEAALHREGEAVVLLADGEAGRPDPADFPVHWHNDYFKAQSGTFLPFIVRIEPPSGLARALVYVRAQRRAAAGRAAPRRRDVDLAAYPFEEIYPVEFDTPAAARIARGFALRPGAYDLTVVVREREPAGGAGRKRLAAVVRRGLEVPDLAAGQLATSSIIVADRLSVPSGTPSGGQSAERPYLIAGREIQPADDRRFRRDEELIVVFLVYNAAVSAGEHFDLEVEYHFFRTQGREEAWFNRTEPQRFNRSSLGPSYDPSSGQPLMAGQGVPLAGFPPGDYRLSIVVRDHVGARAIERQVAFSVTP